MFAPLAAHESGNAEEELSIAASKIVLNIYAVQEAVHQVHVECTPEPRNVLSTTGSNKDTHRSEPRKSAECPSFSVSFRLTLSLTW